MDLGEVKRGVHHLRSLEALHLDGGDRRLIDGLRGLDGSGEQQGSDEDVTVEFGHNELLFRGRRSVDCIRAGSLGAALERTVVLTGDGGWAKLSRESGGKSS
jgi:hypothetical protein